MSLNPARLRPARRTLYTLVGLSAVAGVALVATTSAMAGAAAARLPATDGSVEFDDTNRAYGAGSGRLAELTLPDAPPDCSDLQLTERLRLLSQLDVERQAELRATATSDELAAIRDRAGVIVFNIRALDQRCFGGPNPDTATPPPSTAAPAVADPDRVLVALEIECAEIDLSGVESGAADRTAQQVARDEAEFDDRLATDYSRYSDRVTTEQDPGFARNEFTQLAANLAATLESRRIAALDRVDAHLADRYAATCDVIES